MREEKRNPMFEHPDRAELIKEARSGSKKFREHIKSCPECQLAFELLRVYDVAGSSPLPDPPVALTERAAAIMKPHKASQKVRAMVARLVFDSWAMPQPLGVRGGSSLDERRMRFEAEGISLDLRAERSQQEWAFVAEIIDSTGTETIPTLEVDSKRLPTAGESPVQWTAAKPPSKISIRSADLVIHTPELKWRKSRSQ
jgi:hypothetical protein